MSRRKFHVNTEPTKPEKPSRRTQARVLNKATQHKHRLQEIDIPTWLLKPHQPATRIEVYTLLRRYDQQARWRDMALWKKVLLALWYIVTAPIRLPWRWMKRAWARRHQAEDPPEQEQVEDEGNGEVVQ